jgi:hypothetical protein
VPNLTFKPVTITIHYRPEDVVGMNEEALKLYGYNWSSGSWIEAEPCGGSDRTTIASQHAERANGHAPPALETMRAEVAAPRPSQKGGEEEKPPLTLLIEYHISPHRA